MTKPWYQKRRVQRQIIGLLVGLIMAGLGYYSQAHPAQTPNLGVPVPAGMYRVVKADDGDTIVVDMDGHQEKVRFIGIDTPEVHDPRKAVQCFGQAASNYTKQRLGDQPVRLETDPLSTNRDRYNRLLRYVYLPDGTLLNADLIKQGYAFAYLSFPFTKQDEFHNLQIEARQSNAGLWSHCNPSTNQYGGYTSNDAR